MPSPSIPPPPTLTLAQATLPAGTAAVVNLRVSTSANAVPSGSVTIRTGSTTLAAGTLANGAPGVAYLTLTIPTTALGTYPIAAFYAGDTDFSPSDSSAVAAAFTVTAIPITGALTLSTIQAPPQTPITLTAAYHRSHRRPHRNRHVPQRRYRPRHRPARLRRPRRVQPSPRCPSAATPSPPRSIPPASSRPPPAVPQTLTITPPLTATLASSTLTLSPGNGVTGTLLLTPLSGFSGAVTVGCLSPVSYITCTAESPSTLAAPTNVTVHVNAASTTLAQATPHNSLARYAATFALLLPLLFRRPRRRGTFVLIFLAATVLQTTTGCATGGTFGDVPQGTQLLTLQTTAAGTITTNTLTVTVH